MAAVMTRFIKYIATTLSGSPSGKPLLERIAGLEAPETTKRLSSWSKPFCQGIQTLVGMSSAAAMAKTGILGSSLKHLWISTESPVRGLSSYAWSSTNEASWNHTCAASLRGLLPIRESGVMRSNHCKSWRVRMLLQTRLTKHGDFPY